MEVSSMNYGYVRVLALVIIVFTVFFVRQYRRLKRKTTTVENLEQYEKDENGRYPWEINTDDSPKKIPTDAKRFVEKDKIRRGRW